MSLRLPGAYYRRYRIKMQWPIKVFSGEGRQKLLKRGRRLWYNVTRTGPTGGGADTGGTAMLRIWIGRANTGKSGRVLAEIARAGDAGRQILLVPEHATYQAELDL